MNEAVNPRAVIGANQPPLADQLAIDEAPLQAEVQAIADRANQLPRKIADATADADIAAIGGVVRDAIGLAKRAEERRVKAKEPFLEGGRTVDAFYEGMTDRLSRITVAFERLVRDYREEKRLEQARKAAEEARAAQQAEAERRKAAEEAERKGRERTAALERQKAEAAAQEAERAQERAAEAAAPPPAQVVKQEIAPDVTLATKGEWTSRVTSLGDVDLEVLRPYLKPDHIEAALRMAVRQGIRECKGAEIKFVEKVSFK